MSEQYLEFLQAKAHGTEERRGAFALVHQSHGDYWLHDNGRCFIVRYDAIPDVRAEYWQAYTSKAQPPKGRYPWTVDNRRITHERGVRTFEDAARATDILFPKGAPHA